MLNVPHFFHWQQLQWMTGAGGLTAVTDILKLDANFDSRKE
jgi:hypothetical protein